jgi:hemerythrin
MTIFLWHDDYAIGNATIDAQHRKIIDIINLLHSLLNEATPADAAIGANEVFDQLAQYVMTHFAYEEQLMTDAGYPVEKVIEHKRQHDKLLAAVQQVVDAYHAGDTEVLAELLPYLYGDWLIEHICHSDREYASYL